MLVNWIKALTLVALLGWFSAAAQAAPAPDEVVRKATDDLLTLIEQARGYAEEDPERFYKEVEALLSPVVDFRGFARSVMATHYKVASPEQRNRFAETFKWGLVRTYALTLLEFGDQGKVRVMPSEQPSNHPRRGSVNMEIETAAGEIYPVVYTMALGRDDQWLIRNLIINGVNIGLTYRSQFASAAKDRRYGGDLDKVIDAWGEVVAETEAEVEAKTSGKVSSS
jgi:phospholipid transport system substrate-binding protein